MKVIKEQRLYIKNLPDIATVQEIEAIFANYGKVIAVDIKERKNYNLCQSRHFAFITIEADDHTLQKCFKYFVNNPWCGENIEIQIAKQNFLERLQQERKDSSKLSDNNFEVCTTLSDTKQNHIQAKDMMLNGLSKKTVEVKMVDFNELKKNDGETSSNHLKMESAIKNPLIGTKFQTKKTVNLTQSELKRIESVNQMITGYHQQKSAIKIALSSLDSKRNNKIIFDESTGMSKKANPIKGTRQSFDVETGGNQLFESDEELEDNFNFEVKTTFEGKKGKELFELQSRYKNDKRFVLNESFINDEDEDKSNDNEVKDFQQISAEEEKKRQFEILEEVLSGKLKQKLSNSDQKCLHRRGMLRFDPTQSNHLKYEIINIQNSDAIKRKSEDSQIDDNDIVHPPKASKKVFYKVSDDLKETLQNAEKISLLNLFGKPEDTPNFEKKEQKVAIKISDLNQEPNPFQYDSSDDENLKEQDTYEEGSYKINSNIPVNISKFWTEPFFFRNDDFRLQEGLDFMKRMMFEKKSEFMQLRKNLKYIIKAKVRNNKRRNKCFKKKLGGSKKKKILRIKKALKR